MKTSLLVSALALITVLGVSSCSKKSDDVMPAPTTTFITPPTTTAGSTPPTTATTTTPTTATVSFQVKIDGASYAPDFAYAKTNFPGSDGYYAVYGLDSKTSDVVVLALPSTVGEGTFPINNVNAGLISYNKVDYTTINAGSGTVTITEKTAIYITGTFSFTAYDATGTLKRTLTDGKFKVNFRE